MGESPVASAPPPLGYAERSPSPLRGEEQVGPPLEGVSGETRPALFRSGWEPDRPETVAARSADGGVSLSRERDTPPLCCAWSPSPSGGGISCGQQLLTLCRNPVGTLQFSDEALSVDPDRCGCSCRAERSGHGLHSFRRWRSLLRAERALMGGTRRNAAGVHDRHGSNRPYTTGGLALRTQNMGVGRLATFAFLAPLTPPPPPTTASGSAPRSPPRSPTPAPPATAARQTPPSPCAIR
jgi:hypothetical protein